MMISDYPDVGSQGLYSIEAVARLIRVRSQRVKYWLHQSNEALCIPPRVDFSGAPALSFMDLLQVRMVELLLAGGYRLDDIRKAIEFGREKIGIDYPLLSKQLHVEARQANRGGLLHYETESPSIQKAMVAARDGQFLLHALLEVKPVGDIYRAATILQSSVQYLDDRPVWTVAPEIANGVVADPKRSAGIPILSSAGLPVSIVAEQAAILSDREVAEEFEIAVEEVEAAKRFSHFMSQPVPLRSRNRTLISDRAAA